jgi:hypothetical protein
MMTDSATTLAVIACGEVTAADPGEFSRNAPSFFADPIAWLVAAAVEKALAACPEDVLSAPDEVGMVAVSGSCTALAMREIARTASRGMVSPLRFAGANPGVLAGLGCITWKLRGPTLTLSMHPIYGIEVAAIVATSWLRGGQARYVLTVVHLIEEGWHVARCAVTRSSRNGEPGSPRELHQQLMPAEGVVGSRGS